MAWLGLPRAYFEEIERQIDRLPDGVIGAPIEPVTLRMSRAERAHRRAAHQCFRTLVSTFGSGEGRVWWIEIEPDIRLPGDLLGVPDIACWRLGPGEVLPMVARPGRSIASLPGMEGPPSLAPALTPTLCCKVISADTAKNYREARLPFYARAGVQWFWLIDPTLRAVEVLENAGGELVAVREAKGSDEPSLQPFDKPIKLASWWLK